MTTIKPAGFLRRTLNAFLIAREREADLYVSRKLLTLDDHKLHLLGYDRSDLERRANRSL